MSLLSPRLRERAKPRAGRVAPSRPVSRPVRSTRRHRISRSSALRIEGLGDFPPPTSPGEEFARALKSRSRWSVTSRRCQPSWAFRRPGWSHRRVSSNFPPIILPALESATAGGVMSHAAAFRPASGSLAASVRRTASRSVAPQRRLSHSRTIPTMESGHVEFTDSSPWRQVTPSTRTRSGRTILNERHKFCTASLECPNCVLRPRNAPGME